MSRIVLVFLLLAGCSSSGSSQTSDMANPKSTSSCTGTVSGNVSATFGDCTPQWIENSEGKAAITINGVFPDHTPLADFSCTFQVSGDATANTFGTMKGTGLLCGMDQVINGTQHGYQAIVDGTGFKLGSATIVVTDDELFGSTSSGTIWDLHGSFDATLSPLPGTGDTGSLVVHSSF